MYFPVFIDLSKKNILVVGAGTIAARRIRTLCGFAGIITVVAPEIAPEIQKLAEEWPVVIRKRCYEETDLEGQELVLAATDDPDRNAKIARQCRERGIPVNVSSDQGLCDFQFPSIVQDGDVVIGINASGRNHHLVKETRQKLERCLDVDTGASRYAEND
jgi:siroheme synthase-like protein